MLSELPAVIRKYCERHRNVGFVLREMSTSAIEDAVRSGEIDLGFLRETEPARPLISEVILTEPVVAVIPAGNSLAKSGVLRLEALRAEPFIFFPRRLGPALHDRFTSACAAAGFVPKIVQEATQWSTVVSLVEAGIGVSLAPGCVRKFRWRGVVYRSVPGLDTRVSACWQDKGLSPTASEFLRLARTRLSGNVPRV
jgi:DNA-binding transcriptional LysR family regulator